MNHIEIYLGLSYHITFLLLYEDSFVSTAAANVTQRILISTFILIVHTLIRCHKNHVIES